MNRPRAQVPGVHVENLCLGLGDGSISGGMGHRTGISPFAWCGATLLKLRGKVIQLDVVKIATFWAGPDNEMLEHIEKHPRDKGRLLLLFPEAVTG